MSAWRGLTALASKVRGTAGHNLLGVSLFAVMLFLGKAYSSHIAGDYAGFLRCASMRVSVGTLTARS
jgi:hypothetical protein